MSFGHGEFNAKAKNATCDHGNGVKWREYGEKGVSENLMFAQLD